ncbi:MAG: immunoglobulin-like domain-containing protein [Chitinophagales bacterium]
MVRTLLTFFLLTLFVNLQAQEAYQPIQPYSINTAIQNYECQDISGNEEGSISMNKPITTKPAHKSAGVSIGTTTYDLQTNTGVARRVMVDGDNVYAMWTYSNTFDIAAADRGTGFNESTDGGETWRMAPTERLEDARNGWPNIGKTENGRLFSLAHFATATNDVSGLSFAYRPEGSSDWVSTTIPVDLEATWARAAADGNTIHVIASRFEGEFFGILAGVSYIRSTDAGDTWEEPILLPRMEEVIPSNGWSGDTYFVDAKDGTVAVVLGRSGSDLIFYKSTDNGDTWNDPVIITDSTAPNVDTVNAADTDEPVFEPAALAGGQISVIIDNQGETHIWYDRVFNTLCNGQPGICYLPNSTALMYWKESYGEGNAKILGKTVRQDYTGECETSIDFNEIESQSYGISLVGHASAGIDDAGALYLAFSSMRDGAFEPDRPGRMYRDVYLIKSMDNGETWEGPYNVSNDPTSEDVYPSIARHVDGNVHLVYQQDEFTGVAVNNANGGTTGQDAFVLNNMQYVKIPVGDITTPSDLNNTCPIAFTYVNGFLPNPLEGCEPNIGRFDTHVFDFPDGDITDQVEINYTFDLNVVGSEGYWILTVTDSDGNMIEDIPLDTNGEPILQQVLADDGPPNILLEPSILIGGIEYYNVLQEIDVVVGTEYIDPGAISDDLGDVFGCPSNITTSDNVDTSSPTPADEPFEVIYTAEDHLGNTSSATRSVNVIGADIEAPIIQLLLSDDPNDVAESGSILDVEVEVGAVWEEPGYYAFDNVDLDLTSNVVIGGEAVNLEAVGDYTIAYNVVDEAGNIGAATRIISVRDRTGPTVNPIGPIPAVVPCGGNYIEFGANAFDAVDGSVEITIGGDCVCPTEAGSYIVTYTASDASGNETTESRLVIVQDNGNCTGPCPIDDPESPCFTTGIEDSYLFQAITMRPNPTKGLLNIDANDIDMKGASVEIYNLVGKLISTTSMEGNTYTVDLTAQPAGIYVVKVNTAEGSIAKKVVLDK